MNKTTKDSPSFIYIGRNTRESNESKVGMTSRSPKVRESETTNPYYSIETSYPLYVSKVRLRKIEADIHILLGEKYRRIKHAATGKNSEWFSCSPDEARVVIESYLMKLPKTVIDGPCGRAGGKRYPRKEGSTNSDAVLDITAQVIKDCVNRKSDGSSLTYHYKSLYFRCPGCKSVTLQGSSTLCSCSECDFDIAKYSHLDKVPILLHELESATSINSKQAILFDIYNSVFSYQVQQMNTEFELKRAAQTQFSEKYFSDEAVQIKENNRKTPVRSKLYNLLLIYIFVSMVLSLFFVVKG